MRLFKIVVFSLITSLLLISCGGGGGGSSSTSIPPLSFNLSCTMGVPYTPFAPPIRTTAPGATTTVIALHGKNGLPDAAHMQDLATQLNTAGYDVVRPYLPWSNTSTAPANPVWDADLCTALSYIDYLITQEKNGGMKVILLGHSLAGPIVLAYNALSNSTKPDALAVLAPGHFPGTSSNFDSLHAADVARAEDMVSKGNGDVVATFQTSNGGIMQDIDTTANIYLSYHSPKQFPDIRASIPLVTKPTLWLAGLSDPLTTSAKSLGIIDVVNSRSNYDYREITGDHISMVSNAPAEIDPWYQALP
jgi:pimeloyl-ACP methyl ester carboxylesterase